MSVASWWTLGGTWCEKGSVFCLVFDEWMMTSTITTTTSLLGWQAVRRLPVGLKLRMCVIVPVKSPGVCL